MKPIVVIEMPYQERRRKRLRRERRQAFWWSVANNAYRWTAFAVLLTLAAFAVRELMK